MATPTYDPIASTTLTLPALSVTFSSLDTIAAGYRDLVCIVRFSLTGFDGILSYEYNGDTTSGNYTSVNMQGNGSTASSGTSNNRIDANNQTAGSQSFFILQIFDFSATDKHKSMLARTNNTSDSVEAYAGRWANTAAITSLRLFTGSTFAAGATFSLYGIAAV